MIFCLLPSSEIQFYAAPFLQFLKKMGSQDGP